MAMKARRAAFAIEPRQLLHATERRWNAIRRGGKSSNGNPKPRDNDMSKFGWDLPPGCTMRDVERAYGEEPPENCVVCRAPLDEENRSGVCPAPKDCAHKLEQRYREEAEAEAKYIEESNTWGAQYAAWKRENPE